MYWSFYEVRIFLRSREENDIKNLFLKLIDMLDGKISAEELNEFLTNSETD